MNLLSNYDVTSIEIDLMDCVQQSRCYEEIKQNPRGKSDKISASQSEITTNSALTLKF